MPTIADTVWPPYNGVAVSAYLASRFASPPAEGAPVPDNNPPDGGPVSTGTQYGSIGEWSITVPGAGDYYVLAVAPDGINRWQHYSVPATQTITAFTYTQGAAANVWTVAHGLNRYASVTVIDSGGNQVEGDVHYVDPNNLTVTFAVAHSGTAYLI